MPYFTISKITTKLDLLNATYDSIAADIATYTSLEEITFSEKKLEEVRKEMLYWEGMLGQIDGSGGGGGLKVIKLGRPS